MQQDLFTTKDSSEKILTGLNTAQKDAVTHRDGPLLIIAGAGTGKTTVITRRIAYLIEQKLAKPSEILALTFTEKAASEMEERVDMLVPYGYTDMWISTFHAFGDRLLRDHSLDLGLPANFKVLTATEQAIFMRQNIYAFDLVHFRPIASPLTHISALLNHFSRLKDELISPEQYLAFASLQTNDDPIENEKTLELANAYARYQDLMIQSGNLDFGDQLYLTYKLLKENKKVLGECHKRFKYVLVDEYQDTNFAQNEIVKLLSSGSDNITVVGDDDQSIYRFRGASISNILDFNKTYPKAKQVVLNENYRSTQEILDSSYRLIQNNNPDRLEIQNKINKRLVSTKHGVTPELLFCDNLSCEADKVAEGIKELKEGKGYKYNDFALLVRANNQAEPFLQSFNIAGIPYIFSGSSGLFAQPEIKMLVAFLKSIVYTDDSLALYQLATSELYGVSHDALSEYYTESKRRNRAIIDTIDLATIGEKDKLKIESLVQDVKEYSERKAEPCGELLYDYLKAKKYLKKLIETNNTENEIKIHNIAKFFDRIAQFNHGSEDRGVHAFLNNLELILEVGDEVISSDIDRDIDAVNILTAHASKGLEWPVVFIANCVADRFPGRQRRDPLPIPDKLIKERLPEGDFHLQEERRLFYVAATRAKTNLFLTAAEDYGGKRSKKLSQFVMELIGEADSLKLKHKLDPMQKIERFKKLVQKPAKLPNKFTDETLRLSRQQIDDYYSCPRKFYFAHVVKIPLLENQFLMYGTAIHAALDHYFNRKINGEIPTLEQLLADYETAFKNIGFITRDQEELRYKQGLMTLTRFYNDDSDNPTNPTKVEEVFEFSENKVKVNGRYDLICGVGESAEIRDFKTSDVREQKDADRRIKDSTQMKIYALAWYEKYSVIPKTTLLFIESGLRGEITYTEKDLEETKEMIMAVAEGLRKQDLKAKPDMFQCKMCPYSDICPDSKK
ncbi:MAG: ATP-dependent DNA helicase [Patescibacteria group bacterium]|jgi:DNA helicase-2/ATP-dependent DNA helicase PcrA